MSWYDDVHHNFTIRNDRNEGSGGMTEEILLAFQQQKTSNYMYDKLQQLFEYFGIGGGNKDKDEKKVGGLLFSEGE